MSNVLARRAPSHAYARAYRALLAAHMMLQDPQRCYASIPHETWWELAVWDISHASYHLAMRVAGALRELPEFSDELVDAIYAACWKVNPTTEVRGDIARVEWAMAAVWWLCDAAAREEAGAVAIVTAEPCATGTSPCTPSRSG